MEKIKRLAEAFSPGATILIFCPVQDIESFQSELNSAVEGSAFGEFSVPTTEVSSALSPSSVMIYGREIHLIPEDKIELFAKLYNAQHN